MKKSLIALIVLTFFASSSFAGVSFLSGAPVGQGKLALLGLYGTNHNGSIGGAENPQMNDTNNLGIRGEYGITESLDVLFAYTMDTYPNLKSNDVTLKEASTTGLGLKYAVAKAGDSFPVDASVVVGIENSTAAIKSDTTLKSTMVGDSVMAISGVFSKRMGMIMPYGAVALKKHSQNLGSQGAGQYDLVSGTGLGFNIGCAIGVAENQAVLIEYNTENIAWGDTRTALGAISRIAENSTNVSGISLGYVYMF